MISLAEDTKILGIVSVFTRVVSYKINISKSIPFYIKHKQLKI